jgi:phage shock protein A
MPKSNAAANGDTAEKHSIEQLKQRYNELHVRQIQAGERLNSAKEQLEKLQKQAREQYGTDKVEELRTKLATMEAENERRRAEYQADLDRIETELATVEEKFAAP